MKTNNKALLHDAVSEMIQLHAFDHLLDAELANFKNVLNQWVADENEHTCKEKLFSYLNKVNFFVENISPAAIQLWFYALSYNNFSLLNLGSELQDNNIELTF
jgi:predicted DNA-binding protein YlxM (UPF0122 family)